MWIEVIRFKARETGKVYYSFGFLIIYGARGLGSELWADYYLVDFKIRDTSGSLKRHSRKSSKV